jgi:hypothetical protein
MRHRKLWLVVPTVVLAIAITGCKKTEEDEGVAEPASVEQVGNTDVSKVTLEPEAAKRIDLQTEPVKEEGGEKVVPYAAVLYDADGGTFVYASPEPLTFQREEIEVGHIEGERAFLKSGPAVGTEVVTRAAQEVYGTEFGVDE